MMIRALILPLGTCPLACSSVSASTSLIFSSYVYAFRRNKGAVYYKIASKAMYFYWQNQVFLVKTMKSKMVLMVVGLIILLMGILGLVPDLAIGTEPMWHAALKVVIGLVAIVLAWMDK